eukprot:753185-Prymnesium_polylepis.2
MNSKPLSQAHTPSSVSTSPYTQLADCGGLLLSDVEKVSAAPGTGVQRSPGWPVQPQGADGHGFHDPTITKPCTSSA